VRKPVSHVMNAAVDANISNTTAPPETDHPKTLALSEAKVPALVIALSAAQPERVGDVALLTGDRSWVLGREEDGERQEERARPRLRFGLQRPSGFTETGPLQGRRISRRQLLFTAAPSGIEVECVGKSPLRVNDVPVERAMLEEGDVLSIGKDLVLLYQRRVPLMARRAVAQRALGAFGQPDAMGILGESNAAWILREQLAFAAKSNAHVLVHGPSGTGKELAARAIHALSSRASGPFIARNAATLPAGLLDAELFGNAKNYPNAGMPERAGLVGEAHGGTLFLDEIGEMPEEMQAHLLRLLDGDGEYHRLGESRARRADVRIVGATNRPLTAMKHDVLARLTVQIELPSLHARREDIPLLVRHLLARRVAQSPEIAERFAGRGDAGSLEIRVEPALVVALLRHAYTTNVRELDALLWQSMLASGDDRLDVPPGLRREAPVEPAIVEVDDLLGSLGTSAATEAPSPLAESDAAAWSPAETLVWLQRYQWHQGKTAAALGISRHTLARRLDRMKKDGILPD
jgi:DNA-binding NtrC family response regulator